MSLTVEARKWIHGALLQHFFFFCVLLMLAKAISKSYCGLAVQGSEGSIDLDYNAEASASTTLRCCSLSVSSTPGVLAPLFITLLQHKTFNMLSS